MYRNFEGRLSFLNSKINKILSRVIGINADYTNTFTPQDYLQLKHALADVNNVLTLKLTLAFIDTLKDIFNVTDSVIADWKTKINNVGPNTKGFDIEFDSPKKILAEVKCYSLTTNRFSAIQKKIFFSDVYKLKYKANKIDSSDYYKFIVILDCGDETMQSVLALQNYRVLKPNEEREKRIKVLADLEILNDNVFENQLDKDKVYIVLQKI